MLLIGHRGNGQNSYIKKDRTEENTLASFQAAQILKADMIELDIQVTKDKIPIIVHDWRVGEKQVSLQEMATFENPTTLAQVLLTVNTRLNLEIKYPSVQEKKDFGLEKFPSVSEYCLTILKVVEESKRTDILFSSFSPKVCEFLKKKTRFPVMFITDLSLVFFSLEQCICFCSKIGLFGIVIDSNAIIDSLYLVRNMKERNLVVYTYGALNNSKLHIDMQREAGVDGLITDELENFFYPME